jgi:hypothetical protein
LRHCSTIGCVHHPYHVMYNSSINHHQLHQWKLVIPSLLFLGISGMNLCVVEASVHLTLESLQWLPWVLPIFLGDLVQTDKLNSPKEIPKVCSYWTPYTH